MVMPGGAGDCSQVVLGEGKKCKRADVGKLNGRSYQGTRSAKAGRWVCRFPRPKTDCAQMTFECQAKMQGGWIVKGIMGKGKAQHTRVGFEAASTATFQ